MGPRPSSASVRIIAPVAPFGCHGFASSAHAVPAMSRCAHGQVAGELLQEHRRGHRAGRAARAVEHVGDLALQRVLVLVEERHRPDLLAAALRRRADGSTHGCGVPNRPVVILPSATTQAPVSVATSTRCVAPSCRAYQSASPRISRPSASVLITSTVLPDRAPQHVAGLHRAAAGHVLGRRHDADDADRRLQQRDRAQRGDHGGAAGHVVLHPLHAVGRLDRDAAGVERDALADQAEDEVGRRAGRLVARAPASAAARRCRGPRPAAAPCPSSRACARRRPRR